MSPRTWASVALLGLLVASGVATAASTPWACRPGRPVDIPRDFTSDEVARAVAHRRRVRPWAWASAGLGTIAALALGLTPLAARLVRGVAAPLGGSWPVRAVLGTVALTLALRLVTLPLDAGVEAGQRHDALSTRSWRGWALDLAKGYAVSTVVLVGVALGMYALIHALPDWWWLPAALLAAGLAVLASFVMPVVVEPIFNRFTPLPPGQLRDELLAMARRDGVPVRDVLVADASRRSSALNAYVSGLGATRRIVLFDTLLQRAAPAEARLVVAHELGHAAHGDVRHGTVVGALSAAAGGCAAYLALTSGPLLGLGDAGSAGDPASLGLLLALGTLVGLVTGPFAALVSRRVESRADLHALGLTGEPDAFIAMQHRLAVVNQADLAPPRLAYFLFASHPTTPERIALARAWQRREQRQHAG